jgi:hypothetical protein
VALRCVQAQQANKDLSEKTKIFERKEKDF